MSVPIRVLHVFGSLNAGGAESRIMDIYREINKEQVQFDFALHTSKEGFFTKEVKSLGGKVFTFPRFNGKNYSYYKKAWEDFFFENPEYSIVHGHLTSTGFIYFKIAKKNGIETRIAHSRSSTKNNFIKRYTCKLNRFYANHLFAVSKLAGYSEFGKNAVESGRVKIIPNAIEAKKFEFNIIARHTIRKEFDIDKELVFGHVGRFHHLKNHFFLLKVFKQIKEKYSVNSKLILVGDGELKNEIKKLIIELKLEDSVILTGVRSDVKDILQAMDLLLFPSHSEGLPGVVLEAQAAGLPSLISNNITREVKITDLVNYESLQQSEDDWAKKAMSFVQEYTRRSTYKEIVKAGFDIKTVTKWYQSFYLEQK